MARALFGVSPRTLAQQLHPNALLVPFGVLRKPVDGPGSDAPGRHHVRGRIEQVPQLYAWQRGLQHRVDARDPLLHMGFALRDPLDRPLRVLHWHVVVELVERQLRMDLEHLALTVGLHLLGDLGVPAEHPGGERRQTRASGLIEVAGLEQPA